MDPRAFFSHPSRTSQRHYEAMRAFYHEGLPAADAAKKFGLSPTYFKKLRFEFAHNLYRVLAKHLPGFEHCTVDTINRKFLENGARVSIEESTVTVSLKKKTHLPILFELPWMKQTTRLSWMNLDIRYVSGTAS